MKNSIFILFSLLILAFFVAGCTTGNVTAEMPKTKATIFKSSSCGCCGLYTQYMDKKGFDVEVKQTENMDSIKNNYNIPFSMQSCHTTAIGNYFVEGHVPVEAIQKLLAEKPDVAGIAMPGMPSGSPGMPGAKLGPFVVYAVEKDGSIREFMKI